MVCGKRVLALMRGLNAINDVEENRNYLLLRIVASLYLILMIFAVLLSLLIMGFRKFVNQADRRLCTPDSYLFDILIHFRTPLVWRCSLSLLR